MQIPSMRELLQIALLNPVLHYLNEPTTAVLPHDDAVLPTSSSSLSNCPATQLSCPLYPPAPAPDSCCQEGRLSGHFLLTQFWDARPALGSNTSWTLHGLWPDHCNGGFEQFCDRSRLLSALHIEEILSDAASTTHPNLLTFMNENWLSLDHRNSGLWAHEWNKHGTCVSTIQPRCYSEEARQDSTAKTSRSSSHEDMLDYFTQATSLFSKLDTYATLEDADIVPTYDKTYALADLQAALNPDGDIQQHRATVRCNYRHELDEVWYHFLVKGPLRGANSSADPMDTFVPTKADGQLSNCPRSGIKYLPKNN